MKPVTEAKEVATAAAERGREPRCPTNITEITCRQNWRRLTAISGPASHSCFFTSSFIPLLFSPMRGHDNTWSISSFIIALLQRMCRSKKRKQSNKLFDPCLLGIRVVFSISLLICGERLVYLYSFKDIETITCDLCAYLRVSSTVESWTIRKSFDREIRDEWTHLNV